MRAWLTEVQNWSALLTLGANGVLVCVTAWYAVLTRSLMRSAESTARSAIASAELARQSLAIQHSQQQADLVLGVVTGSSTLTTETTRIVTVRRSDSDIIELDGSPSHEKEVHSSGIFLRAVVLFLKEGRCIVHKFTMSRYLPKEGEPDNLSDYIHINRPVFVEGEGKSGEIIFAKNPLLFFLDWRDISNPVALFGEVTLSTYEGGPHYEVQVCWYAEGLKPPLAVKWTAKSTTTTTTTHQEGSEDGDTA